MLRSLSASWALVAAALVATASLAGCPFATHGDETTPANGGAGGSSASSTSGSGAAGSASASVAHSASASASTGTGGNCASKPEICDDGIDNNCDGKVDCEDPQCAAAGYACAPPAPNGWTVVDFTPDTTPACTMGYGNAQMLSGAPNSPNMCSCTCGAPTKNPCAQGMLTIAFGFTGCGAPAITLASDGTCNPIGSMLGNGTTQWADAKAKPLTVQAVASAATGNLPALTAGASGRSCAPAAPGGKGCPNAAACMPVVPAVAWCIRADGDMPCPTTSFTHRYVVSDTTDVIDGRSCNACACTSTATSCSNASFTSYDNAGCTGGSGTKATIDNGCHNFVVGGNDSADTYFKYDATPDTMACSAAGDVPLTGSATLKNAKTICCP